MTANQVRKTRDRAGRMLAGAGIAVTPEETAAMEVVDFGLGDLANLGLEIIVYENNDRYCAKELVLFPKQLCPEHRHPPGRANVGKQETFRCRAGVVYLYVPGEPTPNRKARVLSKYAKHLTVWHEVILRPGEQFTIPPDTKHWFRAGARGAIVSEFSSTSWDETDVFTDPAIRRVL